MARKIISQPVVDDVPAVRAAELRSARISDTSALGDLRDKIARLWSIEPPEAAARLRTLGTMPLQDPSVVNGELYQHGQLRAVLFKAPGEGVWVLYALGSAATSEERLDGDNAFVQLTAGLVGQLRPRRLVVPELDRLVRSIEHVSQLWRAVRAHVDEIRSADERIGIHEPYAEMRFMLAALAASTEARTIRLRTFFGRMQATVNGLTVLKAESLPLGYRKGEDKSVTPWVADRPVVARVVEGMAAGLSDRELVAEAAAAGGTSLALQRRYGPSATFLDHSHPAELARSWYACLEVWEHGVWQQALKVPDPNREDYDGHVVHCDERGDSYIVIPMRWGLPEGGWASPEAFEKAHQAWERRSARARPTGGAAHSTRRPLSGVIDFTRDEDGEVAHYRLFSDQVGVYQLRRRVLAAAADRTRGWGRRPHLDGDEVAKVRCSHLHAYLADRIVEAIADGVPVEFLDSLRMWREGHRIRVANTDGDPRAKLEAQLERARRRCDNFERSLADAPNEEVRQRVGNRHAEAVAEVSNLEQQLADLESADDEPFEPPEEFTSEIGFLTACLATLRETHNTADRDLGEAVASILEDCQLRPIGTHLALSTYVRVPARGGVARVPVTGTLPADGRQARATRANSDKLVDAFLSEGLTVEHVARRFEKQSIELIRKTIVAELKTRGFTQRAAEFILAYTPASLRQVLWASLTHTRWPDHVDPDFAKLAVDVYRSGGPIGTPQSVTSTQANLQAVCDYLAQYGGTARRGDVLAHLERRNIAPSALKTALTHRYHGTSSHERLRPRAIQRCPDKPTTHVRLVDCPHCGGFARLVNRLPEVPQGLLCPDCRRMPTPNSPVYPADYVDPA